MNKTNIKISPVLVLLAAVLLATNSYAGKGEGKGKDSQSAIESEISYLAKRLLDLKGTDSYTIERTAFTKPYIGICTDMKKPGVAITCVTPDSQASKSGLKTGDLMTSINGISMADQNPHPMVKKNSKPSYWTVVNNMKVGDKLNIELLRAGEPVTLNVIVGSLQHPAFKLEVKK